MARGTLMGQPSGRLPNARLQCSNTRFHPRPNGSSVWPSEMEFLILGPLEARNALGPVTVQGRKPRAVLAYLVLHANEPVSAERLAVALWGEDAPPGAIKTVQVHVSRLRKALGDGDIVVTTPAGYRLSVEPAQLDAERFRQLADDGRRALNLGRAEEAADLLREALALWRGPPLADLAFEPFAQIEIARLEEQRLGAVEARVEADLAAGRHAEVVAELSQLLGAHPTREGLARQLMVALYRCGRQAEALDVYRDTRRRLTDELGVEPGRELRAVQEAILRHDDALLRPAAPEELPPELDGTGAPPLVGRDAELAWLLECWAVAQERRGVVVALTGRPGIGRTRLAAALAGEVHRGGGTVLYAAGRSIAAVTSGAGRAGRPLLLVLDDAPARATPELARALRAVPGLVLAIGEAALADADLHGVLELEPLAAEDVRAIAAGYAPDHLRDDVPADWLVQASDGVPARVHALASRWARREVARRVERVAARAAAGRAELRSLEAELVGGVAQLERTSERAGLLERPAVCPFKGLAAFEAADAPYFFGRERLVAELVTRLVGTSFLGVVGPSGSGKSSVLRAGLLPALAGGVLPGSEAWAHRVVRPGKHPLEALQTALDGLAPGDGVVVAVDQFEETFTACRDERERAAFVDQLVRPADGPDVRAVVVALRADLYGRCAEHPALSRALAGNHLLVGPMRRDELLRAIECPAQRAGLRLEPGLAEALVTDVERQPGGLPLLSTALLELWQRREGQRLTNAGYARMGGVRAAVARLADEAFESLEPAQKALVRGVLLRLVEVEDTGAVERRRVPLAEIQSDGRADVARVIELLADRRLLTISAAAVEIAHEALLREWPRLTAWIEEDRAGLRIRRNLAAAAREWERLDHDAGVLYAGARLDEALAWQGRGDASLSRLERSFLRTSRQHAARTRAVRRRWTAIGLTGMGLAMVAITTVAILAIDARQDAEGQRDLAVSRQLTAAAADALEGDPSLSLALARRALAAAPTDQAATTLRQATLEARTLAILDGHVGRVYSAALSADGRRAVSAGRDGTVRLWDVDGQRLADTLEGPRGVAYDAAFSPDGRRVAAASEDGTVTVWTLAGHGRDVVLTLPSAEARSVAFAPDGQRLAIGASDGKIRLVEAVGDGGSEVLGRHAGTVMSVRFSPDGSRIASGSADGTAAVWDITTGARRVLRGHEGFVGGVSFSPDGARVVTAGEDGYARVWEAASGALRSAVRERSGALAGAEFSADGRRIVVAGTAGIIAVWDVDPPARLLTMRGHRGAVVDVAVAADSGRVISAGDDATVRVWQPAMPQTLHVSNLYGAVPLGDDRVAAWSGDGAVRILRTADGGLERRLPGRVEALNAVAISRDGRVLVAGGADGVVRAWDLPTGRMTALRGAKDVAAVAISPDGSRVAGAGAAGEAIVWRLATAESEAVLRGPPPLIVDTSFSPDGERLVTAAVDGAVRIWPVRPGSRPTVAFRAHDQAANGAAFSPSGDAIVTAGGDGTARVWGADGSARSVLRGQLGQQVFAAAFSPDGRRIVTGGSDGAARVWSSRGGEPLVTLTREAAELLSVAFTPDGRRVMSANTNGTVRLTACEVCGSLASVRALAERRADRPLTAAERQRYLAR